jgi:hypothetical protein
MEGVGNRRGSRKLHDGKIHSIILHQILVARSHEGEKDGKINKNISDR